MKGILKLFYKYKILIYKYQLLLFLSLLPDSAKIYKSRKRLVYGSGKYNGWLIFLSAIY
jgi:hypothetical protein